MNVRIISGAYGGRVIDAPSGDRTHPMSERVRNALFNSIGSEVAGARVLDAFAGTGVVGLEALSRGAQEVVFVERDKLAQRILAGNLERLGASEQAYLIKASVASWLQTAGSEIGQFDLIFADPPYHHPQLSTVAQLFGLLKPNGLMVLSHAGRGEVPVQDDIVVVDNRSYGNAHLTFFRRK